MMFRYREIQRQKAAGEREGGFTLIELLIVIVVLGILAAVVVFALGGVTGSSAQAACNSDAKSLETAVAAYQSQTGNDVAAGFNGAVSATNPAPTAIVPTYLHSWPTNPNHYYIGIGMTSAGNADEVDIADGGTTPPAAGTAWTSYDSQTSTTGCNSAGVK